MAATRTRNVTTAFTAGELSPRILGRSDLEQHKDGLRTCENFIVHRYGGASYRAGTRYAGNTKLNGIARLVSFRFSTQQQYTVEFGNLYCRFWRNDNFGAPVLLSNAGTPAEVVSPYLAAELFDLTFCQSADTLIICHPSHAPMILQRIAPADTLSASWTLTAIPFIDGPYGDINDGPITITPSATTGTVTLTASAPLFTAADVGRWVRLQNDSLWGWAQITVFTSTTVVTAVVTQPFGLAAATDVWRMSVWFGTNWPSVCCFHQERLWFAATPNDPQTRWGSFVGDYFTFSPSDKDGLVTADAAFDRTLSDNEVNAIDWLVSDRTGLVSFTSDGAFVLSHGDDLPLTPADANDRKHTGIPSHPTAEPLRINTSMVFWQRARYFREYSWSVDSDRLDGPDLTLQADHIGLPMPLEMAYVSIPDSIVWTCMLDGTLAAMTYERAQRVVAWHRHSIAAGFVESVESIVADTHDELWMVVRRTIDGNVVRFVEVLQQQIDNADQQLEAWHLDAALRYVGAPTMVVSGLDHLEGETVGVVADAATEHDVVVTGGSITLERESGNVLVGYRYTGTLTTAPLNPQAPYEQRGVFKRVVKVMMRLVNSLGGFLSTNGGRTRPIDYRRVGDVPGAVPPLSSRTVEAQVDGSSEREFDVTVTQDVPQPLHILNLIAECEIGDA